MISGMATDVLDSPHKIDLPDRTDDATDAFLAARPRLLDVAHRVLGSRNDAEDIVQETWLRWQATDRTVVRNPPAFLATTTLRLAINAAGSARSTRETPTGEWVFEPIDGGPGPEIAAERAEGAADALHLLFDSLTASECAAYVLREAFGYPYRRIAEVLHLGIANCRQLVSRAQRRLPGGPRRPGSTLPRQPYVSAFLSASTTGNLTQLERMLADHVRGHDRVGSRLVQ
jgi:RNA polymerase sigma-70 factor (ECF subfamily)